MAVRDDGPVEPPPVHSVIAGILHFLPAPGQVWPKQQRVAFLNALGAIFNLIYEEDEGPCASRTLTTAKAPISASLPERVQLSPGNSSSGAVGLSGSTRGK